MQGLFPAVRRFPVAFKCTFFFEGLQANPGRTASAVMAWTETWYRTDLNDIDQMLASCLNTAVNSYLGKRSAMLHALYAIKWVRVSDTGNPRLTKLGAVNPAQGGQLGAPAEADGGRLALVQGIATTAAQLNCAVEVDFSKLPGPGGDITHHRRFAIRGLPRSIINGNILNENGEGMNALVGFSNYIGRGASPNFPAVGFPCPYKIQYQVHPLTNVPITGLTIAVGNPRQIVLTAALGPLALNDRVEIRNATGIRGTNRIWTVAQAAAGPPYTLAKSRFNLAGAWDANSGLAHKITYAYGAADEYTIIGLRNRKFGGGVFGRTRGRRRAS
jgi:hypothetical protein